MIGDASQALINKNQQDSPKKVSLLRLIIKDRSAMIGLIIISIFFAWSIIQGFLEFISNFGNYQSLGYILLPHDPFQLNPFASSLPPSTHYLLGTNSSGEDILSRILYAVPRDAFIAVIVVGVSIGVGAVLGIIAGYIGKFVDDIVMRITDAFLSVPPLILVIAVSVILNESYFAAVVGLLVVWWPIYARFFRGEILKIKRLDYVQAAKLNNVGMFSFFFRYLFMNSTDPIIAYAALDFGNVILMYSTLAFLGIGLSPPIPELGSMAANGVGALPMDWWWALAPGFAILIIVIGFVLVGDRMQDIIANRVN